VNWDRRRPGAMGEWLLPAPARRHEAGAPDGVDREGRAGLLLVRSIGDDQPDVIRRVGDLETIRIPPSERLMVAVASAPHIAFC